MNNFIKTVREKSPLVHCITNYVTVNDVANIILAIGASPVMADGIHEVEDVTSRSDALVINLGTLNERTIDSMILAGKKANELGHPIIFDPVGAGASTYRTETSKRLLAEIRPAVIRGNASEIKAISGMNSDSRGVDAGGLDVMTEENLELFTKLLKDLSLRYQTVAAMTGSIDLLSDGTSSCIVRNGHSWMSKITGTGCMLDGVLAAFLGSVSGNPLKTCAASIAATGLCGEIAYEMSKEKGTGSFRTAFLDAVSRLDDELLKEGGRIEIR